MDWLSYTAVTPRESLQSNLLSFFLCSLWLMGCTTLSRNGSRTGCCTRLSCISRSTPEFRELFHHLLDPLSALLPKLSADHIPLSVQVVDCLAEDDRTPVMTMIKQ